MKRNWKKALCGILTGFMLATAAPAAVPELISVAEVQAAVTVAAPAMSSIKISGRNKIIFSWKQVKGAAGYRVYRKTGNSGWKAVKTITGSKNVTFTDTKVSTGARYTYTVKAYRKSGKNIIWSGYNKKGLTAIAGLNSLTLNKTSLTLTPKKTEDQRHQSETVMEEQQHKCCQGNFSRKGHRSKNRNSEYHSDPWRQKIHLQGYCKKSCIG